MLTTSSRLISRKKPRHVERGFVADHEQEMNNDIITNGSSNVGLDVTKPKPLNFVTLFLAAIAIIHYPNNNDDIMSIIHGKTNSA